MAGGSRTRRKDPEGACLARKLRAIPVSRYPLEQGGLSARPGTRASPASAAPCSSSTSATQPWRCSRTPAVAGLAAHHRAAGRGRALELPPVVQPVADAIVRLHDLGRWPWPLYLPVTSSLDLHIPPSSSEEAASYALTGHRSLTRASGVVSSNKSIMCHVADVEFWRLNCYFRISA